MKANTPALLILLGITLSACASGPPPPPRIAQGIQENQRGLALLAKGEDAKALEHFGQALQIAESLEDGPAMATNLLNIARTQRRLGQQAAAQASLNRLLDSGRPGFPKTRRIEAAYEATTMALEANQLSEASAYLHRGEALCPSSCQQRGQLLGLRGHLALLEGQNTAALKDSQTAVRLLREDKQPEHLANALRTQALALLAQNQPGPSIALLEEALDIDKARGASRAIFKDLLILGQAWQAKGQSETARNYYSRAQAVARADGYPAGIAKASESLAGLR